ncbi:MAG: hypothetical protein Fues2KO_14340 [Fuerstiella sp.]
MPHTTHKRNSATMQKKTGPWQDVSVQLEKLVTDVRKLANRFPR